MPAWTKKQRRQYEHIKGSSKERGKSTARDKQIAARTVNKQRRQQGETPNKSTQGTGNPNRALDERTKRELYNIAQEMKIEGRSRMNKRQLVQSIRRSR